MPPKKNNPWKGIKDVKYDAKASAGKYLHRGGSAYSDDEGRPGRKRPVPEEKEDLSHLKPRKAPKRAQPTYSYKDDLNSLSYRSQFIHCPIRVQFNSSETKMGADCRVCGEVFYPVMLGWGRGELDMAKKCVEYNTHAINCTKHKLIDDEYNWDSYIRDGKVTFVYQIGTCKGIPQEKKEIPQLRRASKEFKQMANEYQVDSDVTKLPQDVPAFPINSWLYKTTQTDPRAKNKVEVVWIMQAVCTCCFETWRHVFKPGQNKKWATVVKELAGLAMVQQELVNHAKTCTKNEEIVSGTWIPWRDLRANTKPGDRLRWMYVESDDSVPPTMVNDFFPFDVSLEDTTPSVKDLNEKIFSVKSQRLISLPGEKRNNPQSKTTTKQGTWEQLQFYFFLLVCEARKVSAAEGYWTPHLCQGKNVMSSFSFKSPEKKESIVPRRLRLDRGYQKVGNESDTGAASSCAKPKEAAKPKVTNKKFWIRWDYVPPSDASQCPSIALEEELVFGPNPTIYFKGEGAGDRVPSRFPSQSTVLDDQAILATHPIKPPSVQVGKKTEEQANKKGYKRSPMWPGLGKIPIELRNNRTKFRTMVVCGDSGSGKTTFLMNLVKDVFPSYTGELYPTATWDPNKSLADAFGTYDECSRWLGAVGMSSVPTWVKPYGCLSVGEKYRANIARILQARKDGEPVIFDEWTSELDRELAKALCLAIRKKMLREQTDGSANGPYIFACCNEDVISVLQPDLVVFCKSQQAPRFIKNPHNNAKIEKKAILKSDVDPVVNEGILAYASTFAFPKPRTPQIRMRFRGVKKEETSFDGSNTGLTYQELVSGSQGAPVTHHLNPCDDNTALEAKDIGVKIKIAEEGRALDVYRKQGSKWSKPERAYYVPSAGSWSMKKLQTRQLNTDHLSYNYDQACIPRFQTHDWYLPEGLSDGSLGSLRLRCLARLRTRSFAFKPVMDSLGQGVKYLAGSVPVTPLLLEATKVLDKPTNGLVQFEVPAFPSNLEDFEVGVLTGASGCGKTSLARLYFGPLYEVEWREKDSVLSHFESFEVAEELFAAAHLSMRTAMLCFPQLSAGEQWRAKLARMLAMALTEEGRKRPLVLEEFGSLLDRDTASAVAAGFQRFIRKHKMRRVVIVSSHRDFLGPELINPDWVYDCLSCWFYGFNQTIECQLAAFTKKHGLGETRGLKDVITFTVPPEGLPVAAKLRETLTPQPVQQAAASSSSKSSKKNTTTRDPSDPMTESTSDTNISRSKPRKQNSARCSESSFASAGSKDATRLFRLLSEGQDAAAQKALKPPPIELIIRRAIAAEWNVFRDHHYKDKSILNTSSMYVGTCNGRLVAFCAIVPNGGYIMRETLRTCPDWQFPELVSKWPVYREHRTVIVPDFQGLGFGSLMADSVGEVLHKLCSNFCSMTKHPFYGSYRDRSDLWIANPEKQGREGFAHSYVGCYNADKDSTINLQRLRDLEKRLILDPPNDWTPIPDVILKSQLATVEDTKKKDADAVKSRERVDKDQALPRENDEFMLKQWRAVPKGKQDTFKFLLK